MLMMSDATLPRGLAQWLLHGKFVRYDLAPWSIPLPSAVFWHRRLGTSCGGDRSVTAGFDRSAESDCSLTEAPVRTHGRPRPFEAKVPGRPRVCAKADAWAFDTVRNGYEG
jgi:hypothetical protein